MITVKAPPERAFARFTREIARWCPLHSHSVGEADAESVVMEERVGGRIVERTRGGAEFVWGTIDTWELADRLAELGRAPLSSRHLVRDSSSIVRCGSVIIPPSQHRIDSACAALLFMCLRI